MIAALLYMAGVGILVWDTNAWGLSTLGLMMIFIASAAGPKE